MRNTPVGLGEYLRIVRAGWLAVVGAVAITVGAALGLSLVTTPTYVASATVFLSRQLAASPADRSVGLDYAQAQVGSFSRLAVLPVVLDPVIDELDLDTTAALLARHVDVAARRDAVVLTVRASQDTPVGASRVADAVARRLVVAVEQLVPRTAAAQPTIRADVVAPARTPTVASAPRTGLNLAVALVLGSLAGGLWAVWRDARGRGPVRSGSGVGRAGVRRSAAASPGAGPDAAGSPPEPPTAGSADRRGPPRRR